MSIIVKDGSHWIVMLCLVACLAIPCGEVGPWTFLMMVCGTDLQVPLGACNEWSGVKAVTGR